MRETHNQNIHHILYSIWKDPRAIRARMALYQAGITIELREVQKQTKQVKQARNNPEDAEIVPSLIVQSGNIIDDSLKIMEWALSKKDKEYWIAGHTDTFIQLIQEHEKTLSDILGLYEQGKETANMDIILTARNDSLEVLKDLNDRLQNQRYLFGTSHPTIADIAIFPFIYNFSTLDPYWFDGLEFSRLHQWLTEQTCHPAFRATMTQLTPWELGQAPVIQAPWGQ